MTSRRATRTLFALGAVVALLSAEATQTAFAADPPADPLQGPFVDAGLVETAGPDASSVVPPRLLVVRAPDPAAPGSIFLELLGVEGAGWTVVTRLTVTTGLSAPGPATLVPLNGRFALIASDATAGQTYVGLIASGPTAIRQPIATFQAIGPTAAGAADVDGDGSDELILIGDAVADEGGGCLGSPLVVMSDDTLAQKLIGSIAGIGLDGGAIGRFGSRGGDDLIAYVHVVCEPGAVPPFATRIAVVDLATGKHEALEEPFGNEFGSNRGPLVPLLVDLDGDGIDEPILRSSTSLVVVDPAQDWRPETIDTDAIPLAVVDRADRPRLVVEEPGAGELPARIRLLAVGRVGGGGDIIQRGLTVVPAPTAGPTTSTQAGIDLATDPSAPTPSWAGDLTGSGCLVVLVPLATLRRCPDTPTVWTARPGPAWLQTVPLAAYGDPGARRLLVAAGVGWSTTQPGMAVPAPAATYGARTGRWRTGPSAPFALAVVDPEALAETSTMRVPAISVDPNVVDPAAPRLVVAGRTGDRILARIGPVVGPGPGEVGPLPSAGVTPSSGDLGEFLTTSPSDGYGSNEFIPVPARSTAGADPAAATFSLPSMEEFALPVSPAVSWMVTVVGLNAFGEPSPMLDGRVELDLVGPSVAVEPPFLSLPWPLSGQIKGRTEPGARLRLAKGSFVEAARDGSFELDAALAPWPQDLTIEALDAHGNRATVAVSVVGGVDYRQLPWQGLVIVGVLFGAGITSFGAPLRRRSTRVASAPVEGQPHAPAVDVEIPAGIGGDAEIEDLPAAGGRSRS